MMKKKGVSGFGALVNIILTMVFVVLVALVYRYVVQTNAPESFPISYPFFNDSSIPLVRADIPEPGVLAIKKSDNLIVGNVDSIDIHKDRLRCIDGHATGVAGKVILDPTHGGLKDRGLVDGDLVEAELVRELALRVSMTRAIGIMDSTRDLNRDHAQESMPVSERIDAARDFDIIISFSGAKGTDLVAYVPDNVASKRAACEIINEILGSRAGQHVSGFGLVPIDPSVLPSDDPRRILSKDKLSVNLEVGFELFDKIDANSIAKGVSDAFK